MPQLRVTIILDSPSFKGPLEDDFFNLASSLEELELKFVEEDLLKPDESILSSKIEIVEQEDGVPEGAIDLLLDEEDQ